jgi:hypothetical protein
MSTDPMRLAFCIANGFPFPGVAPRKVRVLYVNFELPEAICRARFEAMLEGEPTSSLENIRFISVAEHLDQLEPDFIDYLLCQKRECEAELIILGSCL